MEKKTFISDKNRINNTLKPEMDLEVASGDISSTNAKNCAQFSTPRPQSFGRSSLPAGHATEKCTSRLNRYIKSNGINKRIKELYIKPTKENILFFLTIEDKEIVNELYSFAGKVREEYTGNFVHLRGLIEFSNYCFRSCHYCGLNKDNKKVPRFRILKEEIVKIAIEAANNGYKTIVLQSGEDKFYSIEDYVFIIKNIKSEVDVAITLAIGEKTFEEYKKLRENGADRYLLKHETSDSKLYHKLNPGMSHKYRIDSLRELKRLGFQVGSGIMIGLPGQTIESIADDILLFKELNLDMIGCGPFISHEKTPLAGSPSGNPELAFRVLAINRIITRDTNLPYTTALSVLTKGQKTSFTDPFFKGANVLMPKLTPLKYQKLYDIYPNDNRYDGNSKEFIKDMNKTLSVKGLKTSTSLGNR